MAEQSYNLKYTGKEIDDLLDKANDMDSSAQVPTGGSSGQVLTKKSGTDFDAEWKTPGTTLPSGGTAGQVLTKNSSTAGDASWETPATPSNPLPTGGTAGQALVKNSSTNYDVKWADVESGGGSTSSDVFVIVVSGASSSAFTANKTYDEMVAAYQAGKAVIMVPKDIALTSSSANDASSRCLPLAYYRKFTRTSGTTGAVTTVEQAYFYSSYTSAVQSSTHTSIPSYYIGWTRNTAASDGTETISFSSGTNYAYTVPYGGTAGQILAKEDSATYGYNFKWINPPSGGDVDNLLIVNVSGTSSSNYEADVDYETVYDAVQAGVFVVLIFKDFTSTYQSSIPRVSIAAATSHYDYSSDSGPDQYTINFASPVKSSMYIQSGLYAPTNISVTWRKTKAYNATTYSYQFNGSATTCYQIPTNGTDGQVLVKDGTSTTDHKVKWADMANVASGVSTSVIVDSGSQLPGSASRVYTFSALHNGDRVIVLLQRESGRYTTNEYTWYGASETKLMVCHPNDNQGCTIFGRAYLESTQITLAQTAWWSGYEYTGALSNTLVTGYKVIVARYS